MWQRLQSANGQEVHKLLGRFPIYYVVLMVPYAPVGVLITIAGHDWLTPVNFWILEILSTGASLFITMGLYVQVISFFEDEFAAKKPCLQLRTSCYHFAAYTQEVTASSQEAQAILDELREVAISMAEAIKQLGKGGKR
jgi:hypothetical protein